MKKIIIGVVAVVVVIAAAGAGYALIKKNNSDTATEENQSAFNPASTEGQAFIATVTATPRKNKKTVTVMKTDGQGASEYLLNSSTKSRMVFTKDFYYVCAKNSCSKFSSSASHGFISDPNTYDVSQADINNAQEKAVHEGQQPCPTGNGTCDVWSTEGLSEVGTTAKVYVDSESRRVVQIDAKSEDGVMTKIVYDYKPVTITIPKNAHEIKFEIPPPPEME